ncbi:hypothetical protein PBAC_20940 [Pedobacter glucosidilyticus]|uniref:DUF4157 domain-containing protein n=1 Tax=Pedobacter aquae TaxID=2605747 RepID=A0A5C0VIS2_9SPHI|nr:MULTISPECIES: hypothetical protein [Pedobacter]KHJ37774.1 hypothetical protein PBAC_20940 [Pedobacter glucosidilyticus]QEK52628.1 hypothetical protein FYC62_13910 [Pedobacter aquae]
MWHKTIHCPWLHVNAMALYPFILVKAKHNLSNQQLINHELIHFKQQIELLILPFYLFYIINYLVNLLYYRQHHKAYLQIIFEQEAYKYDMHLDYIKKRKFLAFLYS